MLSIIYAATSLLIMLWARVTPIDTETPTPPTVAAAEADPANARIREVSCASMSTLPAMISDRSM